MEEGEGVSEVFFVAGDLGDSVEGFGCEGVGLEGVFDACLEDCLYLTGSVGLEVYRKRLQRALGS